MKLLALALVVISSLPPGAAAKDVFKNLPGVKDPAVQKEVELDTVCTSQLERAHATPYRNGLAYRTYSCQYGKVTVRSNRPPDMIEYRKYRERYQAQ